MAEIQDESGFIPDDLPPVDNSLSTLDESGFVPDDAGSDESGFIPEDTHGKGSLMNRTLDFLHQAADIAFESPRLLKPLSDIGKIGKYVAETIESQPLKPQPLNINGVDLPIPTSGAAEFGQKVISAVIPKSGPQVAAALVAPAITSLPSAATRIAASGALGAATRIAEPDPTIGGVVKWGALGAGLGAAGELMAHFIKGYGVNTKPLGEQSVSNKDISKMRNVTPGKEQPLQIEQKVPPGAVEAQWIGPPRIEYKPSAQYGEIVLKERPQINLDRIGRAVQAAKEQNAPIQAVLTKDELAIYNTPTLKPQFDAYGNFKIPFILNEEERRLTGMASIPTSAAEEMGFSVKRPAPPDWSFEKRNLADHGFAVRKEFTTAAEIKPGQVFYYGHDLAEVSEEQLRTTVAQRHNDRIKELEAFIGREAGLDFNFLDVAQNFEPSTNAAMRNYQESFRWAQERSDALIDSGLSSVHALPRNLAKSVRFVFGQAGSNPERQIMNGRLQGMTDYGIELAHDAEAYFNKLIDSSRESQIKINDYLDPELASKKVTEADLTLPELKAVELHNIMSNLVHDANFSYLGMPKETWLKNRGKYVARGYEPFENDPVFGDVVKQKSSSLLDTTMFMQRGKVDEWKLDNALRDPGYMMTKRVRQMLRNLSLMEHFNWLNKQDTMVSSLKREGWVKMGEGRQYGPLSGKYVRKDAIEDIRGFFFTNNAVQSVYDVLQIIDRSTPMQYMKMSKTALNPTVQLGNILGDIQFAHLNGLNPIEFTANTPKAIEMIKSRDPIVREMRKLGMLGNSYRADDVYRQALQLREASRNGTIKALEEGWEFLLASQGKVDDIAKVAAVKTHMDNGRPLSMALKEVMGGFQNYRTVGALFHVGGKIPVFGNKFISFSADLARILKNSAERHPLRLAGALATLSAAAAAWSVMSGESARDRRVRESRVGFRHIPFMGIPLEWKMPWGGVWDVGRMIGLASAFNPPDGPTAMSELGKFLPLKPELLEAMLTTDNEKKMQLMGMAVQDPLLGPAFQAYMFDRDFRGRPIADPQSNPYRKSYLTPEQKRENINKFLVRSHNLPTFNDIADWIKVNETGEDYYGKKKSPMQAGLRLFGIKMEKYGPEEVEAELNKRIEFHMKDIEQIKKNIVAATKNKKGEEDYGDQLTYWNRMIQEKMGEINELSRMKKQQ